MKMKLLFLLLCLTTVSLVNVYAQSNVHHAIAPHICATMEQDSISRLKFPQRGTLLEFEEAIQQQILAYQEREKTGRRMAAVINIPIIVHVVHNGEAVGSGTNISQAQVQAQIEVLNEDFRRKSGTPGFNNHPSGADIEIEFCLSPVDQNGNVMTEPGIHRYNGNRPDWTRDQIENNLKPFTIWNPNKFYNIWTVKFAASDANLIGYAQFPDQSGLAGLPDSGPASTDGVVVRYQSFGSTDKGNFPVMQAPYNKGRTLSHETGHWLGLRHIWGDGVCADDFVNDTPPQNGPSPGTCPNTPSCDGNTPAMVQNYMDYSNDACMNIFTQGQKTRMRAVMDVSPRRKTLLQDNLCSPLVVAAPDANFTIDKLQCVLLGSEVTFTDLSTNFPTQWQWEFEGGDPSTSSARNPKVKYNAPGSFKVSLIATNSIGASEPLIIDNYITVSEEGLCRSFTNFEESFTSTVLPISDFSSFTGYLTGHNTGMTKAYSEFFTNTCGYAYISGARIWFGNVSLTNEEATVNITAWNARGRQGGPGAILERKTILVKQILEDIANNVPTVITFDRETPIFSQNFHVGVEINYNEGYSLAVKSSAQGEGTKASSWIQKADGKWELFTIEFGANIAMRIEPFVGMNPSVQVSASKLLIYPGEEVILNGRGASIFVWNAEDGSVNSALGPQLVVRPQQTTTYITTGSGLDLCTTTAYTTIYTREGVTAAEPEALHATLKLYPNPGLDKLYVEFENTYVGTVTIQFQNTLGQIVGGLISSEKNQGRFAIELDTTPLQRGMYFIKITLGDKTIARKWIKN